MSAAQTWTALTGTVRVDGVHSYTDDVMTGFRYAVFLPMTAEKNGRRVADTMTPRTAREIAAQLLKAADDAESRNRSL